MGPKNANVDIRPNVYSLYLSPNLSTELTALRDFDKKDELLNRWNRVKPAKYRVVAGYGKKGRFDGTSFRVLDSRVWRRSQRAGWLFDVHVREYRLNTLAQIEQMIEASAENACVTGAVESW